MILFSGLFSFIFIEPYGQLGPTTDKPCFKRTNVGLNYLAGVTAQTMIYVSIHLFLLPLVKFFSSVNFPPTFSFSCSLYKCIWFVIVFVISLIIPLKMASAGGWKYLGKIWCLFEFIPFTCWPSQLGVQNTLTASLQRSKIPPMSALDMILNNLIVRLP